MSTPRQPVYRRLLLKLSGEALTSKNTSGINPDILSRLVKEIAAVVRLNVQVGIVVGGGNLFRGAALTSIGIDRITGDQMGIMATVMNSLALRDALERVDIATVILSAIPITGIVDPFDRRKAIAHLNKGKVVIFSGGTGNPLVTTDSAASLRGIEIHADVLLKATNVDGIYSSDPARDPQAVLYHHLNYQEALDRELGVMDLTAFFQCRDHNLPIRVFNINKEGVLLNIVTGSTEGTLVDSGSKP